MPPLQVTFLGTGTSSGVPMVGCSCDVCSSTNPNDKRLRSSILVQSKTTTLVVDTGPDFRQQMLTHQVKNLDAVLLTHSHKDHIAGLDDVRAYNFLQKKPMDVYGSEATLNRVRMEFDYAFTTVKYVGVPSVNLHTIQENESFWVGDIKVTPILVWHMFMPVLSFRFGDFTYITDANRIDADSKEQILGSKVLVLNALRRTEHISHFTLQQAMAIADELQISETYFTHLSHQMGLHERVTAELPASKHLAYDGLKIYLP